MGKTVTLTKLKRFYFTFAYRPKLQHCTSAAQRKRLEQMQDCLTVVVEANTSRGAQIKAKERQREYSGWNVTWDLVDVFWVPHEASHGAVRRPVRVEAKDNGNSFAWKLLPDNDSTED